MTAHKGHLSGKELCSPDVDEPLTTVTHLRHYMAPGVQRIPVRYGKVRGCLFLPPGELSIRCIFFQMYFMSFPVSNHIGPCRTVFIPFS